PKTPATTDSPRNLRQWESLKAAHSGRCVSRLPPQIPYLIGMTPPARVAELIDRFRDHNRRALAQALTLIENNASGAGELLNAVYPLSGGIQRVGVTGMPGAGKSTLVAALATELRRRGKSVGVLAFDPSSPLTRGALLG